MAIIKILGVMAALTGVGVLLRRVLTARHATLLNEVALRVTLPVGIFLAVHQFRIDRAALLAPGVFFVLTLAGWGLAELVARPLRLDGRAKATFVLSAVFGNIIYVGYPVAVALYGEEGLAQAVLVDQIGLQPLSFTLGPLIAARGSASGAAFSLREQLLGLLRFPPLVAFVVGLVWNLAGAPVLGEGLQLVFRGVGILTVPLVMVAFGLVLRLGALRAVWQEAVLVGLLRLVLIPVIGLGLASVVGLEGWRTAIVVLQAGTPTMMFTLVLATRYGLDVERSAGFITASMVASAVTLSFWAAVTG